MTQEGKKMEIKYLYQDEKQIKSRQAQNQRDSGCFFSLDQQNQISCCSKKAVYIDKDQKTV